MKPTFAGSVVTPVKPCVLRQPAVPSRVERLRGPNAAAGGEERNRERDSEGRPGHAGDCSREM